MGRALKPEHLSRHGRRMGRPRRAAGTTTADADMRLEHINDDEKTSSGGRVRYFYCRATRKGLALDVIRDAARIRLVCYDPTYATYDEVSQTQYKHLMSHHCGPTTLNGVYLSDLTHTRLARELARLKERDPNLYGETTLAHLVGGIVAEWAKAHLG